MKNRIKPRISRQWWNESAPPGFRMEIRAYNFKELCDIYGLKYRAMRRLIKPIRNEIGEKDGYFYTPLQVETIVLFLGPPYVRLEDEG